MHIFEYKECKPRERQTIQRGRDTEIKTKTMSETDMQKREERDSAREKIRATEIQSQSQRKKRKSDKKSDSVRGTHL